MPLICNGIVFLWSFQHFTIFMYKNTISIEYFTASNNANLPIAFWYWLNLEYFWKNYTVKQKVTGWIVYVWSHMLTMENICNRFLHT